MTLSRDEFLDRFLERAGIPKTFRTPDGVKIGNFHRIAVPCSQADYEHSHYLGGKIGSVDCQGWILIAPPKESKDRGGEYKVTDHRKG